MVQRTAHAGSPLRFCATDKLTPAASARIENFILVCDCGVWYVND